MGGEHPAEGLGRVVQGRAGGQLQARGPFAFGPRIHQHAVAHALLPPSADAFVRPQVHRLYRPCVPPSRVSQHPIAVRKGVALFDEGGGPSR
ncbi:hypothetical protein Sxan_08470 [Streptomyces xanthophaeus]|uniref:Uncharacterized protein n=1 Tax=Streptomyces xanthophaeus TaxID=67385 RepID=A0A919GYJ2_9ACTN|nr:hypothetical protein Sxan_08470 [Streptomyces xanthophaeus]